MMRWLPRGLAARVIGLTLLALLVSQAVSYFSFRHSSEDFVERMIGNYMGQTVAALDSSLQYVEPEYRSQMVRSLSRSRAEYKLQAQPPACRARQSVEQRYARDLARRLNVKAQRVRVCIDAGSESDGHRRGRPEMLAVALQRSGGQWLVVEQNLPARSAHWAWRALRNLVITLVIMTVLVIVATYRFTRPLRDLASAAERFGRGEKIEPLSVRGSDEIRRSIIEFNHMHERIERFVAGRTRLVAALAHDLRTPITAMRIRLELMPEDDNTRAMAVALEDMSQMSEAALTFMREEASVETARRVDLTALVDAICEDYHALGAAVTFIAKRPLVVACRPPAIRRALRNVIDNALAYGKNARVGLRNEQDVVIIEVQDSGPGIAEANMASVFDAFVRLETSRSRETGGVGLGLAIARSIIRSHGGEITLRNLAEGGLAVHMSLPQARLAT